MTPDELVRLGNEKPVTYKSVMTVTFVCLSMRLVLGSFRKQPVKARIRLPSGREKIVWPKHLSPPPHRSAA